MRAIVAGLFIVFISCLALPPKAIAISPGEEAGQEAVQSEIDLAKQQARGRLQNERALRRKPSLGHGSYPEQRAHSRHKHRSPTER
jgi:hypothetical protein